MRVDGDVRSLYDAQARDAHEHIARMYDEALNAIRHMHAQTITALSQPAWPAPTYSAERSRRQPRPVPNGDRQQVSLVSLYEEQEAQEPRLTITVTGRIHSGGEHEL